MCKESCIGSKVVTANLRPGSFVRDQFVCFRRFQEQYLIDICDFFFFIFPAETLPHEENGLMKEQRYMDSASNSMTPRPQTLRSSSEYHSKINSLYHSTGSNTPIRRLSSNPTVLTSTQPHRRVEGTITSCSYTYVTCWPAW